MQQNFSSFKELLSLKKSPEEILSLGIHINSWDCTGRTLLSAAVEKNDKKLISANIKFHVIKKNTYPFM